MAGENQREDKDRERILGKRKESKQRRKARKGRRIIGGM